MLNHAITFRDVLVAGGAIALTLGVIYAGLSYLAARNSDI